MGKIQFTLGGTSSSSSSSSTKKRRSRSPLRLDGSGSTTTKKRHNVFDNDATSVSEVQQQNGLTMHVFDDISTSAAANDNENNQSNVSSSPITTSNSTDATPIATAIHDNHPANISSNTPTTESISGSGDSSGFSSGDSIGGESTDDEDSSSVASGSGIATASTSSMASVESSTSELNNATSQLMLERKGSITSTDATSTLVSLVQQPEGWRVKLYRLNTDGSWDDCGTGRIVCFYAPSSASSFPTNAVANATTSLVGLAANTNSIPGTGGQLQQQEPSSARPSGEKKIVEQSKGTSSLEEAIYEELNEPTLCMHAELPIITTSGQTSTSATKHKVLLRTRVLLREAYQRQGDNIITWCEPFYSDGEAGNDALWCRNVQSNSGGVDNQTTGVDLALSFQDNAGCLDIWSKITNIQRRAFELFQLRSQPQQDAQIGPYNGTGASVNLYQSGDGSASPPPQLGHEGNTWMKVVSAVNPSIDGVKFDDPERYESDSYGPDPIGDSSDDIANDQPLHLASQDSSDGNQLVSFTQLPRPPKLGNLEEISNIIATSQQRDGIIQFISNSDSSYLKALLALFPSAEKRDDFHALATLASIIKSIVLLNDPGIVQLIASDCKVFEDCCCCLEYDPDLRDKANHRWFIRHRLKFRTVLLMSDETLVQSIHRSFRVTYIRDTLLRPTMDESSLSALGSLLVFTHADVVKSVMCNSNSEDTTAKTNSSYLVQILQMLAKEVREIRRMEWNSIEGKEVSEFETGSNTLPGTYTVISSSGKEQSHANNSSWSQHLAPQDNSLKSRKIRRRGCLSFLRELFSLVRNSLQQSDKDDFYNMIVYLDVDIERDDTREKTLQTTGSESIETANLLSLLGAVLSDPNTDISERGACLEILSAVAIHDANLIRKHCFDEHVSSESGHKPQIARPQPNERNQVIFHCPPNDLILSLLFVLAIETDAGVMIQATEIFRIILDTEVMKEFTHVGGVGMVDNECEHPVRGTNNGAFHGGANASDEGSMEQNSFLQRFYEHYVSWLVIPFQYPILIPKVAIPYHILGDCSKNEKEEEPFEKILEIHEQLKRRTFSEGLLREVLPCAIRASFSVELLAFCIRAHCFRMRRFLLRSRVLSCIFKLLNPSLRSDIVAGDRCLKLATLRCLRSILTLKDEQYQRHIIQQNLFAPVFEAFRANPVGDNLVSSSIIEMCDYIKKENIKPIIEYIVTKHFYQTGLNDFTKNVPSLEDVATPYVDTLTQLREKYDENIKLKGGGDEDSNSFAKNGVSEKAREDQRKFREADEEDAYFNDDSVPLQTRPPSPIPQEGFQTHHSFLGISSNPSHS